MSVKAAGLEWRNRVQQDGANKDSWGWHLLFFIVADWKWFGKIAHYASDTVVYTSFIQDRTQLKSWIERF
jgi:hypothetical protein